MPPLFFVYLKHCRAIGVGGIIMEYKLSYSYFDLTDCVGLTIEKRIDEAVALLQNEDDFIVFEDSVECKNADELRKALRERGIL